MLPCAYELDCWCPQFFFQKALQPSSEVHQELHSQNHALSQILPFCQGWHSGSILPITDNLALIIIHKSVPITVSNIGRYRYANPAFCHLCTAICRQCNLNKFSSECTLHYSAHVGDMAATASVLTTRSTK